METSTIVVYKEQRQQFTELSFIKNIKKQTKIQDIKGHVIFNNNLIKILISIKTLAGIKGTIEEIVIKDISEMILTQFKELSFDEIAYAFKLERYLAYNDKTEHYQLFDASYISKILNKYKSWKAKKRKHHNLDSVLENLDTKQYVSEDEKMAIMQEAIEKGKALYLETGKIELASSRYDWLDEQGLFLKSFNISASQFKDIKNRRYLTVKKDLEERYRNKKAKGYKDRLEIKETLKQLLNDKCGEVIAECKKSLLIDYYNN